MRAIVHHRRKHVVVLCPLLHLLEVIEIGRSYAGSMNNLEVVKHQDGEPNRFDRAAERCDGLGHARLS